MEKKYPKKRWMSSIDRVLLIMAEMLFMPLIIGSFFVCSVGEIIFLA